MWVWSGELSVWHDGLGEQPYEKPHWAPGRENPIALVSDNFLVVMGRFSIAPLNESGDVYVRAPADGITFDEASQALGIHPISSEAPPQTAQIAGAP